MRSCLYSFVRFGFFTLAVSVWSTVAQSTPNIPIQFTCAPNQFYSGGYNFYQISRSIDQQYAGIIWWQKTSPHGIKIGKPEIQKSLILKVTEIRESFYFEGFTSEWGESDKITIPNNWKGEKIETTSSLFKNDMNFDDGYCVAMRDS
ncbi:MAG: hypothetical protein NT027_03890 [Proteobacteria bacterium]|nr:hypothetical protein [Pseudomonadota bacterium]